MMLFAGAIISLILVLVHGLTPLAFLYLIPAAAVVFIISLIIGYYLSEPLNLLCRNIKKTAEGGVYTPFTEKGRLFEADCLSESFDRLFVRTQTQEEDLCKQSRRQNNFISDVAHELRTPLTAIHGNAELLTDPELPIELHDKFCQIIIDESDRLGRLTNDLLTLQHIERNTPVSELQRVNLRALSQEVTNMMKPLLDRIEAKVDIVGESPDVLGEPDRLKQVVSNLIENAIRFIKPGGHITIDLFGLKNNSVLTVSDDGDGFGDIDPALLFDRFYRTDSSRSRETGGSGLGLAIVKSIVEAHDGTVEALNLPESGACFIVAIPSIVET